jgi:uncharacterized damage-inducible protein DinB
MTYQFLVDTYQTEIEKVLSTWAMFNDDDLLARPHAHDKRGRSLVEQMIHQSVSENLWFSNMLGIQVTENPLPKSESRLNFMALYHQNAGKRLNELAQKPTAWWEEETGFFEQRRSRAWIVVRRIAHTAHHRGQQTTLLRQLNRNLHSTYGPTADTGGLMQNNAPVVYAYGNADALMREELASRQKAPLPGTGTLPSTERPEI